MYKEDQAKRAFEDNGDESSREIVIHVPHPIGVIDYATCSKVLSKIAQMVDASTLRQVVNTDMTENARRWINQARGVRISGDMVEFCILQISDHCRLNSFAVVDAKDMREGMSADEFLADPSFSKVDTVPHCKLGKEAEYQRAVIHPVLCIPIDGIVGTDSLRLAAALDELQTLGYTIPDFAKAINEDLEKVWLAVCQNTKKVYLYDRAYYGIYSKVIPLNDFLQDEFCKIVSRERDSRVSTERVSWAVGEVIECAETSRSEWEEFHKAQRKAYFRSFEERLPPEQDRRDRVYRKAAEMGLSEEFIDEKWNEYVRHQLVAFHVRYDTGNADHKLLFVENLIRQHQESPRFKSDVLGEPYLSYDNTSRRHKFLVPKMMDPKYSEAIRSDDHMDHARMYSGINDFFEKTSDVWWSSIQKAHAVRYNDPDRDGQVFAPGSIGKLNLKRAAQIPSSAATWSRRGPSPLYDYMPFLRLSLSCIKSKAETIEPKHLMKGVDDIKYLSFLKECMGAALGFTVAELQENGLILNKKEKTMQVFMVKMGIAQYSKGDGPRQIVGIDKAEEKRVLANSVAAAQTKADVNAYARENKVDIEDVYVQVEVETWNRAV
jgi:hypothetical protein